MCFAYVDGYARIAPVFGFFFHCVISFLFFMKVYKSLRHLGHSVISFGLGPVKYFRPMKAAR